MSGFRDDFSTNGSTLTLDNGGDRILGISSDVTFADSASGTMRTGRLQATAYNVSTGQYLKGDGGYVATFTWPWQDAWFQRAAGNLQIMQRWTDAAPAGLGAPVSGFAWWSASGWVSLAPPADSAAVKGRAVLGVQGLRGLNSQIGTPELAIVRESNLAELAVFGPTPIYMSNPRSGSELGIAGIWDAGGSASGQSGTVDSWPCFLIVDLDNSSGAGSITYTLAADEAGTTLIGVPVTHAHGLPGDGQTVMPVALMEIDAYSDAFWSDRGTPPDQYRSTLSMFSWNYVAPKPPPEPPVGAMRIGAVTGGSVRVR